MPRKSAAALSVIPPALPSPPPPPAELTPEQATEWRAIVATRPPEWFDSACRALLVAYCRSVVTSRVLAKAINQIDLAADLTRYGRLSVMLARETKLISMLSAKLRLAPAHVYRVEKRVPTIPARRPWQHIE